MTDKNREKTTPQELLFALQLTEKMLENPELAEAYIRGMIEKPHMMLELVRCMQDYQQIAAALQLTEASSCEAICAAIETLKRATKAALLKQVELQARLNDVNTNLEIERDRRIRSESADVRGIEIIHNLKDHFRDEGTGAAVHRLIEIYEAQRDKGGSLLLRLSRLEAEVTKSEAQARDYEAKYQQAKHITEELHAELAPLRDLKKRWDEMDGEPPGYSRARAESYQDMIRDYMLELRRVRKGIEDTLQMLTDPLLSWDQVRQALSALLRPETASGGVPGPVDPSPGLVGAYRGHSQNAEPTPAASFFGVNDFIADCIAITPGRHATAMEVVRAWCRWQERIKNKCPDATFIATGQVLPVLETYLRTAHPAVTIVPSSGMPRSPSYLGISLRPQKEEPAPDPTPGDRKRPEEHRPSYMKFLDDCLVPGKGSICKKDIIEMYRKWKMWADARDSVVYEARTMTNVLANVTAALLERGFVEKRFQSEKTGAWVTIYTGGKLLMPEAMKKYRAAQRRKKRK